MIFRNVKLIRSPTDNWLDEQANRIGYIRGSHTERALLRGYIEEDEAELIAFKSFYRHTFTDYDQQYDRVNWHELKSELGFDEAKRYMRDFAHESKVESPFSDNWSDYLSKYGFTSPEALAMASVLLLTLNDGKSSEIRCRSEDCSNGVIIHISFL